VGEGLRSAKSIHEKNAPSYDPTFPKSRDIRENTKERLERRRKYGSRTGKRNLLFKTSGTREGEESRGEQKNKNHERGPIA